MPSNANLILERIAAIEMTVAASDAPVPITIAADPYQPSNAESVNCPFWINTIRPGAGNQSDLPVANGQQYITTTYDMILCLARREANIDLKYGVHNTLLWRDAVYAAFAPHIKLSAPQVLILSSTNTIPITVLTNTPPALSNGDLVTIAGHLVNTNANGTWNVANVGQSVDPTTGNTASSFQLVGSTGNGIGTASGTAVKTQNNDLWPFVTDAVIKGWQLNSFMYGDTEYLALIFSLAVREMYVQTINP